MLLVRISRRPQARTGAPANYPLANAAEAVAAFMAGTRGKIVLTVA